jgi:cytochrome P450
MSRDPRNYNNPDKFNPERFLGPEPELDPRKYIFGFGRRKCPGAHTMCPFCMLRGAYTVFFI